MVTLELTQKTVRTNMEVLVMELETRKGKGILSSYEHISRQYTLQE